MIMRALKLRGRRRDKRRLILCLRFWVLGYETCRLEEMINLQFRYRRMVCPFQTYRTRLFKITLELLRYNNRLEQTTNPSHHSSKSLSKSGNRSTPTSSAGVVFTSTSDGNMMERAGVKWVIANSTKTFFTYGWKSCTLCACRGSLMNIDFAPSARPCFSVAELKGVRGDYFFRY
jgi:hypothetical protein